MTRAAILAATTALCMAAAPGSAQDTFLVTNFDASGEGSLQAALDAAADTEDRSTILVTQSGGRIETPTGLTYTSASRLSVIGNGLTVASSENVTLLSAIGPEALSLSNISFEGPGEWSIENRGDLDGPAGKGIFLDVADDARGTIHLRLIDVEVTGVASHGIHVSDCALADECGSGEGGTGNGSYASIAVELSNVTIGLVGTGQADADGLRVDERGPGDIVLNGFSINLMGVGGDGIELDEGQSGDVIVNLLAANLTGNGGYCNPVLLAEYLPDDAEDDFDEGTMASSDIPGPITGSPDDRCFDRDVSHYDDVARTVEDYEFSIDVEDGFDIDEAGPGSIFATFTGGEMIGNSDEGYDFDEAGPGDIDVVFTGIIGSGNTDNAIKLSEAGEGSVYMTATALEVSSNGSAGLVVEEEDEGDLSVTLIASATYDNDGGDLGVEVVQEDSGEGAVYVIDSEIADGIEANGAGLNTN